MESYRASVEDCDVSFSQQARKTYDDVTSGFVHGTIEVPSFGTTIEKKNQTAEAADFPAAGRLWKIHSPQQPNQAKKKLVSNPVGRVLSKNRR